MDGVDDAAGADVSFGDSIQMLGKYTLLDTLGSGAAGVVYHAHLAGPMGFRKQVALKTIPSRSKKPEAQVRALINEARLGGHLEHPNIVSILDFGEVQGTFYIAMEYVQGYTLRDVLRRQAAQGPMPAAVVAGLGVQICRGLSYAHTATDDQGNPLSLIHRDLKPANVMISHRGQAKLLDFGISRAASNLYLDRPGETAGTPAYMSPEQATGETLDSRSDLFSTATLIAEMIVGEPVFAAADPRASLHRVHRVDVGDAAEKIRETHPQFLPVLERAWAQKPKRRYGTADRMARDLYRACRDAGERPAGEPKIAVWLRKLMRTRSDISTAALPGSAGASPGGIKGLFHRLDSWARGEEEELSEGSADDLAMLSMDDSITFSHEHAAVRSAEIESLGPEPAEAPPDAAQTLPESAIDWVTMQMEGLDDLPTLPEEDEAPAPEPEEEYDLAEPTLELELVIDSGDFGNATDSPNADSTAQKGTGESLPGLTTTEEIERVLTDDDVLRWIEVRPGTYWRGSDTGEELHREDEVQHEVTIGQRFLVANVPVTQSLLTAVMGVNPSEVEGPWRPVDGVSWFDAVLFCNVYSQAWGLEPAYVIDAGRVSWNRESPGFRLLTEAEWEYAARAGQGGPFAGAEDPAAVAWFAENAAGHSHDVATRAPNAWGLHDTSGNVWEWVWDRYDPRPEQGSVIDPMGHWSAAQRVARGGSWASPREDIRTARRRAGDVMEPGPDLGLRIARSLF